MRIECEGCGAVYNIEATGTRRRAKCKKCGDAIEIPAEEVVEDEEFEEEAPPAPRRRKRTKSSRRTRASSRDDDEEREKPKIPGVANVVVILSFLAGLVFVPSTLFLGLGAVSAAAEGSGGGVATVVGFLALVSGVLALGLVGGGIGLMLRQAWGWWASALIYGFFLLFNLKMCTPLLHLNYDHPKASDYLTAYAIRHGIPIVLALAMLVILFLPSMRSAYGLKQQKFVRPSKRAGRITP